MNLQLTQTKTQIQTVAICRVFNCLEHLRYHSKQLVITLTPDFVLDRYKFPDFSVGSGNEGERVKAKREFPEIGGHAAVGICALGRLRALDEPSFQLRLVCRTDEIGRHHLEDQLCAKLRARACEPVDLTFVSVTGAPRGARIPLGKGPRQVDPSSDQTKLMWKDLPDSTRKAVLNSDVLGLLSVKDPSFSAIYDDLCHQSTIGVLLIDMTSIGDNKKETDREENRKLWKRLSEHLARRTKRECYVSFSAPEVNTYYEIACEASDVREELSVAEKAQALSGKLSSCIVFYHEIDEHYLFASGKVLAHFPGFDISSAHAQLDEAKISFTNGLGDTLNAAFALAIGAHHKIKDLDAASVGPSLRNCLIFSSAIVQARLRATWRRVYQVYTNELHDLDLLSYYPTRDDVLQFTREVEIAEPRLPPLDEVADLPRDTIEKTDEDLCRLYEAGNFDVVHFAVGQPETRPSGVYMARQRKRKAAQRFVFIDLDYTLFDSSQRVQAAMVAARKCSQGLARLHLEPAAVTEAWSEIYERHQEFRGCGFSDFRQVWSSSDCWSLALAEAEKSRNRVRGTETSSGRIVGQVAHRAREIKSEFPDLCHSLDDSFWKYRFTPFDGIREALESLTALEIQVYLVAEGHSVTQDLKIKYLGLERAIAHERRLFASALPRPFDGKSMAGEFFDDKVEPLQRDEHIATEEIQKKIATELGDVTRALMSRQPGEITPVEKIARLEKELDCLHDDLNVIRQVSRVYRAFRLNLRQLFHAKALLSVLVSPYNPRKFFEDRLETFSDDLLTEEFQRLFTTGQGRLVVVGDRVDSELAPYIEIECPCRLIRLELSTKYVNQPLQGDYMQSIKDIPQLMDALTDSKWWDDKVPRLRVPKITRSLPLGNRDDEVLMKAASQWGNVHHVYANTGNAAREILDRKRVIVG